MSNYQNFGSTRNPSLERGTKVICSITKILPERISKRTGEKKPAENRSKLLSGIVLADQGHSVIVKVQYPSGYTRTMSFFPHELSLESKVMLGIEASRV
jgi:hypothetical protein